MRSPTGAKTVRDVARKVSRPASAVLNAYQEELCAQNEELREAHHALEESRDRYVRLYDNSPVGYLTLDRNGLIEESNLTAACLLGAERQRVVGRPLLVFVGRADRQAFLNHMIRSRNFGSTTRTEMGLCRPDGKLVPVELVTTPARRPRLGGVQYLTTIIDVSDRVRLEAERRAAEEERQTAAWRAESARASSEAKDRFLAILSHELRTPLTPILAAVSMLEAAEDLPQFLRPIVQMVRRNVDMEARLIDDLLDVTRIERNKLRLTLRTVDVHELLGDVGRMLQSDLEAKHLSLVLELKAQHPHLNADASRLRQVFWNLLANAAKFTPDGGKIMIGTSNDVPLPAEDASAEGAPADAMPTSRLAPDNTQSALTITISDTGIGIPPEMLARLFRPFEQADSQRPGLGLGLSIARGLVEAHGGRISAASAGRGLGATFTVSLPALDGTADLKLPKDEPAPVRSDLDSSLITHHSSLITHHSSLITHHSSLITHHFAFCWSRTTTTPRA